MQVKEEIEYLIVVDLECGIDMLIGLSLDRGTWNDD